MRLNPDDFAVAVPFGFVFDPEGALVVVGETLRRRLGATVGAAADETFEIVRPHRVRSVLDLPAHPGKSVLLRALGSNLELRGSILAIDDGGLAGFFCSAVVRDIDEFLERGLQVADFPASDATPDLLLSMQATRSALEDARKLSRTLNLALARAEAAMEAKGRFVAMMSHEIRTPLNGFGAMIDLLQESDLDVDQRSNLETMDRCAKSLGALVNDILDLSKLEAGKVVITRRPIRFASGLRRILEIFAASAEERGIELRTRLDLGDVRWMNADFERVRQVVANLVGNAIKFTQQGFVEIEVSIPAKGTVQVDVTDTGIGIPDEKREELFDPFVQADSSVTRRFGGTGLGLTISRQLARAMGGDVVIARSDDSGTTFRFTFAADGCAPPARASVPEREKPPEVDLSSVAVLIAEDDLTNQLIAEKMFGRLGIEPTIVGDGQLAVEAAMSQRFDIILMDLMMPNLGGVEATRQIRDGSGPCRDVPIIAFSAAAVGRHRDAARAAGMNGFVEKPVRLEQIREILRAHLPVRLNL